MSALVPSYPVSDIERMARAFAASKLFGVQNPEQALALCLVAQAEGRHPASAAQDYHIISGRPAKKADAMLRDFIANGGKVEWHALNDEKADATFSHPSGGTVRIDWTAERAKHLGLWPKGPKIKSRGFEKRRPAKSSVSDGALGRQGNLATDEHEYFSSTPPTRKDA